MGEPQWTKGSFLIATPWGVDSQDGFLFAGLAMHKEMSGSPKGRRPPRWSLTHLGSGHSICRITAHMARAFEIASEVASLSDWDFDGLYGWKNRDPELKDKVAAIYEKYPIELSHGGGKNSETSARLVVEARA